MRRALEQPAQPTGADRVADGRPAAGEGTGTDTTGADAVRRLLAGAAGEGGQAAIGAPGLVELVEWEPAGTATRAAPGLAAARLAARMLRVLPLTAYEVFLAADLVRTYPGLPSRAALHVAIMLNNGELELVSDDAAFDQVSEIRRIPPARLARALARRRAATAGAAGECGLSGAAPPAAAPGPGQPARAPEAPPEARGETPERGQAAGAGGGLREPDGFAERPESGAAGLSSGGGERAPAAGHAARPVKPARGGGRG